MARSTRDITPFLPGAASSAVGRSLALPAALIGPVGRSLALPAALIGPVGRSLALPAALIGPVGRSLALPSFLSGRFLDTFTRTVASGWGSADAAGAYTRFGGIDAEYSVDGSTGLITPAAQGLTREQFLPGELFDTDLLVRVRLGAQPAGAGAQAFVRARRSSGSAYYAALVIFATNGGVGLRLDRGPTAIAGQVTVIGSGGLTGGAWVWLRFQVVGSTVRARIWIDGSAEPDAWQINATDATLNSGALSLAAIISPGNTNTPTVYFDDLATRELLVVGRSLVLPATVTPAVGRSVVLPAPVRVAVGRSTASPYTIVAAATATAVARLSLSPSPTLTPDVRTGHRIHVRARVVASGEPRGALRVALYEGEANRSGDLQTPLLTTTMTDYVLEMGDAGAVQIVDYSDLELRVWGVAPLGGVQAFEVDALAFEKPLGTIAGRSLELPARVTVAVGRSLALSADLYDRNRIPLRNPSFELDPLNPTQSVYQNGWAWETFGGASVSWVAAGSAEGARHLEGSTVGEAFVYLYSYDPSAPVATPIDPAQPLRITWQAKRVSGDPDPDIRLGIQFWDASNASVGAVQISGALTGVTLPTPGPGNYNVINPTGSWATYGGEIPVGSFLPGAVGCTVELYLINSQAGDTAATLAIDDFVLTQGIVTVGRSLVLPANLTSSVGRPLALPATVVGAAIPVGRSLALPATVTTTVGRSLAAPATVFKAVGRSLALPATVTTPVGRSLITPATVTVPVGRALVLPALVIAPVGRALVLPAAVTVAAARSLSLPAVLTVSVGRSLVTPAALIAPVGRSLGLPSVINAASGIASNVVALPYALRVPVGRSSVLPATVLVGVGRSLVLPATVDLAVGRSAVLPAAVLAPVGCSLLLPGTLTVTVGRALVLPATVAAPVARSLVLPATLSAAAGRSLALPAALVGGVGRSLALPSRVLTTYSQTGVARLSLAPTPAPFSASGHSLHVRARCSGGNGTIRIALYQGTVNRSGDLETPPLTGTLTDYLLPITDAAAATITDYSDLEIRLRGYSVLGDSVTFEVDGVSLEKPTATQPVGASLALPSTLVGTALPVGRSLALPALVTVPAGRSLVLPATVRGPVGRSLALPATVIQTGVVGRLTAFAYAVIAPVGSSLTTPATVRVAVAGSAAFPATVTVAVGRSLPLPALLRTSTAASLAMPALVYARAGRSLYLPSALASSTGRALGLVYIIRPIFGAVAVGTLTLRTPPRGRLKVLLDGSLTRIVAGDGSLRRVGVGGDLARAKVASGKVGHT